MERLFDEGKNLFQRQDYAAARQSLSRYVEQDADGCWREEADYMLACTVYELNLPGRKEQLKAFLKMYPESRYANRVRSLVASACFFEKKYAEAIACFDACEIDFLPDSERDDCAMRLGISYLELGDLGEASVWFSILKAASRKYHDESVYHLAYIDYARGKYDSALEGFRQVENTEGCRHFAAFYTGDIYLAKKQFRQALQVADAYLQNFPDGETELLMKRVKGEACYGLGQYAEAARWLGEWYQGTKGNAERRIVYELGMSYFYTGVYSKAAERLNETVGPSDRLTQNAYLHIGLSYLQLKERNLARMAFEQSASVDFDREIKEQALYNYALCIHETSYSPFDESVTVFERFLNEFPQSAYAERVNNYLVEVYLSTRSYKAALNSIEKISQPDARILEAKQKLLFRLGVQSFAQAAFGEAVGYFTQSLQLGRYDQQTKAEAYYWRGESKYRLNQYAEAAADLRQYLEFTTDKKEQEYGLALYCIGYAAFKQKQYEPALAWFSRCIESSVVKDVSILADTYNRIGDCHFYARRFDLARQQYAQAAIVSPSLGDYSLFQEGFVQGLQRDYGEKIQTLNRLLSAYPSSPYIDDALYEQGRAFVQLEDNENAVKRYETLVERYPESPLARKAANEIGLLYYQDDHYQEAIRAYKKVIESYPGSEEARLAQRDLKSIYIDLNRVDEYMAFASSLPGAANFDVNERDSLTYVAAERAYMRGDRKEAGRSLLHYLQMFPEGAFSVNAHYYLGIISHDRKDYEGAMTHLERVTAYPDSKFSGEAMALCADMSYARKDYAKAFGYYKQLAGRTSSQEERIKSETGAMRSAWMSGEKAETAVWASSLLSKEKLAPELEAEARFYRMKALDGQGKSQEALEDMEILAKDTRNVYGAEARYRLAQSYFDSGQTEKAEKEVLDYIEASTPHAYWLARSFVLLSDVYVKLGRTLDAKQYLLSLQQNYQEKDDIGAMIEDRLEKLNTGE